MVRSNLVFSSLLAVIFRSLSLSLPEKKGHKNPAVDSYTG